MFLNDFDGRCYIIAGGLPVTREYIEQNFPGDPILDTVGNGTCVTDCRDGRCPDCYECCWLVDPNCSRTQFSCDCPNENPQTPGHGLCDGGKEFVYTWDSYSKWEGFDCQENKYDFWEINSVGSTRWRCGVGLLAHSASGHSKLAGDRVGACEGDYTPAALFPTTVIGQSMSNLSKAAFVSEAGENCGAPASVHGLQYTTCDPTKAVTCRCTINSYYPVTNFIETHYETSGAASCLFGQGQTLFERYCDNVSGLIAERRFARFNFSISVVEPCGPQQPPPFGVLPGNVGPIPIVSGDRIIEVGLGGGCAGCGTLTLPTPDELAMVSRSRN